jgi:hypothetical protein
MKKRIGSIAPIQTGVVLAALYGLLGLVFVPFILMFAYLAPHLSSVGNAGSVNPIPGFPGGGMPGGMGSGGFPGSGVTAAFGIVMAIIIPLMYAFMGFIAGVIIAAIYNLVAMWTGGIEITLTDVPGATTY